MVGEVQRPLRVVQQPRFHCRVVNELLPQLRAHTRKHVPTTSTGSLAVMERIMQWLDSSSALAD